MKIIDPRHEEPPEGDNWPFGFDLRTDSVNPQGRFSGTVAGIILVFSVVIILITMMLYAWSRDDGRYANSPLKPWFEQLASGRGLCCSFADGEMVQDVDWDTECKPDLLGKNVCHYRVRLYGNWIDVPDVAMVTEPNKAKRAIVWPFKDVNGNVQIRCFMPSSMS